MSVLMCKLFGVYMEEADAGEGSGSAGGAGDVSNENATADDKGDAASSASTDSKGASDKGTSTPAPKADDKADDKAVPWPDDWRQRASKGDEKILKRFERFASPEAALDALIANQNRIRSGELKAALPKNAKPEEIAEWRKDNGIPESVDKYDMKFDSGLVIGDADKPIIDGFLSTAHGLNLNNEQVKNTVEWYYKEQERQAVEREKADESQRTETLDALNAEWGGEFRKNLNSVESVLMMFPESVRDSLKGGRLADGRGIFNSPDVIRAFAQLSREINPAGTLVPAGTGDAAKSVNDEISAIEKTMKENRTAYNKDEKMQARYRDLLGAQQKMNERK